MIELPGPLVDAGWLLAHLDDVYVADVRWYLDGRSGRDAYEAGHVPGAVWVDLDRDLAGPPSGDGGRHPLPAPEDFAGALGRLGIAEDRPVVAYDDASGSIAARLWWMLRAAGQPAAVLDGGIGSWPGELEGGAVEPVPASRSVQPWPPGATADTDEVDHLRLDTGSVLLDARAAVRYQGLEEPVDARPGHIPGARNHPWTSNVGPDGRMLSPDELRSRFEVAGLPASGGQVVSSCGSGVTACHNLLAMEVAGLPDGVLYVGSWSAWSADPQRPATLGAEP